MPAHQANTLNHSVRFTLIPTANRRKEKRFCFCVSLTTKLFFRYKCFRQQFHDRRSMSDFSNAEHHFLCIGIFYREPFLFDVMVFQHFFGIECVLFMSHDLRVAIQTLTKLCSLTFHKFHFTQPKNKKKTHRKKRWGAKFSPRKVFAIFVL